jgi:site-specific recombinase XerD
MNVVIKQFLGSLEARNFSVHTLRAYDKTLTDFSSHLGNMPVGKLDRQHVRGFMRYLGERGLVTKSLQRELGAVRSFAKWLQVEGLVPVDVAHGIMTPKFPTHLPDLPSQAEVRTLLDGELKTPFPERDRALLVLLYATGIRVAELCDIKLEDFEAPDVLIVRGKGKRERRVIYGTVAKAALDEYLPLREKMLKGRTLTDLLPKTALFLSFGPSIGLQGLNVRSVSRIVKAVASAKGLDPDKFHPHALRRCFATHLHDNGCPIEVVHKLLGHTHLSTTVIYTQVSTARMVQSYNAAHPHASKSCENIGTG